MSKVRILLGLVLLLVIMDVCSAEHAGDVQHNGTLTGGFWGLNNQLRDDGIEIGLGITSIYQANLRGGTSTHNRRGRYAGRYDLEVTADMQRLLGLEGGRLYIHTKGRWPKSAGIDGVSVGSAFGVNGNAGARRSMDITELWYEQSMLDGTLLLRIGKMDLTGGFECRGCPVSFDGSIFANDETTQFLNSALVNNPTIPFPDYALGIAAYYNPIEWWYISMGVADGQNDARETGFRTSFHKEDYYFYVFETGITPRLNSAKGSLQGAYRIGVWYDPQPKANSDGVKNYRDDAGFYLSFGQMLAKENSEPTDTQGLGAFFRYGYAGSKRNNITNFFSAGFQYEGLFEGRDEDVLGIGYAHGTFSDSAKMTYPEDYESVLELYYNAPLAGWLNVSPSVQYVTNPGGSKAAKDAVVFGLRMQMIF